MMNVAFVNENTLGHTSYLPRFVECFGSHPEWDCFPTQIDATPLPPNLRGSERGIRGLSKFGLDWQVTRWRRAASFNAAAKLSELSRNQRIDAIVVNTQSVGLELPRLLPGIPYWVALDATFEQLARSPWFRPTSLSGWFHPITLRWLRRREKLLFSEARGLLPWSELAAESLRNEYGVPATRIHILPPSLKDPGASQTAGRKPNKANLLFIGGDFKRKGGHDLVEVWKSYFRSQAVLHVVTRSKVVPENDLFVYDGVEAGSAEWRQLWEKADIFVFPSQMETFGIVLIEAMAFGVPAISANTGAAQELLGDGLAGMVLESRAESCLKNAIQTLLLDWELRQRLAARGRERFLRDFELGKNTKRLAYLLHHQATNAG